MLGHRPALILGAEPVRLRDADVVEEDLVQLMVAGEGADRLDADARRGHVEQQETDPRLWLALGRGTDEAEHAVGEMGVGGPDLRAVADILPAIEVGAHLERGATRPRARFRKAQNGRESWREKGGQN